jgi:protein-L-isoaspartate(D-aspartate) O-methyltransferase
MVPRARFVPAEWVERANVDEPIPIPHRLVTTQPSLVAQTVEALTLSDTVCVLEVGTGLGYQTAILATLAREVHSIEWWPDLAAQARQNLTHGGIVNAVVVAGDGTLGFPSRVSYEAIIVSAAAPTVSPALVAQLAEGGRLVQPIGPGGNEIVTKFRKRRGQLESEAAVAGARFVRLIGKLGRGAPRGYVR